MRFAENPRDRVAGFRVAQLLPGVGPKIAETIVAAAAADDGFAAMAALVAAGEGRAPAFPPSPNSCAGSPPAPRRGRRRSPTPSPGSRRSSRCATTTRGSGWAISKRSSASPRRFPSRERFLSELALDPPDATSDEAGPPLKDEDYLILSTIHSAKGQEWRSVFVLNCVDGCIPSDLATGSSEEIEEERRLLYVAMTRAKDELALIVPQRFYVHGQPKYGDRNVFAGRTRFFPRRCSKHFDRQTWPEAEARAAARRRRRTARRSAGAHAGDVAVRALRAEKGPCSRSLTD